MASKARNIVIIVVLTIMVLVILGSLLTPKETQPKTSPYELVANKVYYYKTDKNTYAVIDLSARYNAEGKWSVWRTGFKLLTDRNSVLEPVVIPFELSGCFKNELLLSIDVTKLGYTPFKVAFVIPPNEKPVKLLYDAYGVKIETPITDSLVSYVSYYDYVNEKVAARPPILEFDVFTSSSPWLIGCYVAGSKFNISINVKVSSFLMAANRIAVTKIDVQGAIIIDVVPKPPVILGRGEEVNIKITLQTPEDSSYSGPLNVVLTVESAK